MLARRFLWIIAIIVMVVIAAAFAYSLFGNQLIRTAMVPSAPFTAPAPGDAPNYIKPTAWVARPDRLTDASRWTPAGYTAAPLPGVAVFYVLPTAVFDRSRWNGSITDPATTQRMEQFLRFQASVFNSVGAIWAPAYRQATFGAFLTDKPEAAKALDLAYADVDAAFTVFLAAQPADKPIILAGHSQGSLLLMRLLKNRIAGTPLVDRLVAVYIPGWPISVTADLPALGLPACTIPDQTGCILSWQSFAQPADYKPVRDQFDKGSFDNGMGLTGDRRLGTEILCTNPLTGVTGIAPEAATANFGALVPNDDFTAGTLQPKTIGARCLPTGILDIGAPPAGFNAYVLPGNNYHVYDFPLFWANLRADIERRVDRYQQPVVKPEPRRIRVSKA
ncbi:hypothetical protein GCM10011529_01330 [Polymorphobacter glacialis]|uniref:DUF3089 domain-containing protein n=1 Tax=Sandarakinorhabdus glacialis TaxID=1614636 RepID=A0A917E2K9_9SPHN|nr:DUF3089 domain-containing protein [Polymorphobacter glacialis]GGD98913.1 hypothetical protein GCM10011529_01330 [Polymorphobacter glacialis]